MSIPSGYHEWAQARGVNAFHPLTWDDADRVAFTRFKLAAFRARWRAAVENGDVAATRRQQGRAYLIRRVQDDLAGALAPPPSETYRFCPCHPSPAWPSPARGEREPRTPGECLAWLAANFTPGTKAQQTAGAA